MADWTIRPQLKALGGIANVIVIGGEYKQYQVLANPNKLKHYGISLQELQAAVEAANVNTTGGFYNEFGNQYNIKGEGRAYDVDDLQEGLIKEVNGQAIRIKDVAEVKVGRLLTPLGIAFITSVLTSLVVAVTVTPVLCSYLLKKEKLLQKQSEGTRVERWLRKGYSGMLNKSLKYSKLVIGGTVAIFLVSLVLFFQLGRSFLPEFNEGSLVISVVGTPGMSLKESNKTGKRVEELLLEMPEVDVVTRRTGRAELDEHAQGVNAAEIDAPFTLQDGQSKEAFFAK
ncbi:unnamed protein product, partial [Symbiodinium sp. CCMP2456]